MAGDLIALAPDGSGLPRDIAKIGGIGKRLGAALRELRAEPRAAGFVPLVGRLVRRKRIWYSDVDRRHATLAEALDTCADGTGRLDLRHVPAAAAKEIYGSDSNHVASIAKSIRTRLRKRVAWANQQKGKER